MGVHLLVGVHLRLMVHLHLLLVVHLNLMLAVHLYLLGYLCGHLWVVLARLVRWSSLGMPVIHLWMCVALRRLHSHILEVLWRVLWRVLLRVALLVLVWMRVLVLVLRLGLWLLIASGLRILRILAV